MPILRRAAVVLATAVVVMGCGDGSPAATDTIVGTYTLNRADGQPLPAVVFDQQVDDGAGGFHFRAEATTGTLTLAADGRYTATITHSRRYNGVPDVPLTLSDHGQWTRSGNTLALDSDYIQNQHFTATVSGGTLTITHDYLQEGHAAEYRYTR